MTDLSLTGRRWSLQPSAPPVGPPELSPMVRQLLGQRAGAGAEAWLWPSLEHLHDPWAMRGMEVAVDRILRAARDGEPVRICTDYDVDGTTSSLILKTALRLLGSAGRVDYHIPDRFGEGYGFSVRAAERAAADGVKLIVTADIGVRDHAAVTRARELGVEVIICDHHLPDGETVPGDALAVLCPPQAGCSYPNRSLAACGVSLKLTQALISHRPELQPRAERLVRSLLKVAAIGTVADVVDLSTPENRAIVALGLEELRRGPHSPGLQALIDVAGLRGQAIEASDLGFRIGPRINAAGRIEHAQLVVQLFDEVDPERARERAHFLDGLNSERKHIQERLQGLILAQQTDPAPFVVAWGEEEEGWHRGVVGIVAARVREKLHRPTAIVSLHGEFGHGSVRSVPAIHAVLALDSARDLLVRYGGHPAAAGFTIRREHVPELSRRLADYVSSAARADDLIPELSVDAVVRADELSRGLAEQLRRLGPFGKGNPEPLLWVRGLWPQAPRRMGERHLRFRAGPVDATWWHGAEHLMALGGPVDLVGSLGLNHYQGQTTARLTVEDLRPCRAAP